MSILTRESWGPHFWFILHTLAECVGEQTNTVLDNDEQHAFTLLLKTQRFVMPCEVCRKHFSEWIQEQGLSSFSKLRGQERKEWVRKWLWGCHDRVNREAKKVSPSLESLSTLYPRISLDNSIKVLNDMFQKALETQKLAPAEVTKWRQLVSRLRILYGI